MAQLVLSARESSITKETSFFANYFRDSNLFRIELLYRLAELAIQKVETLKEIYNNIAKM